MEEFSRDSDRSAELAALERIIGYHFNDAALLDRALSHRSFVNEHRETGAGDNERLEFLGDAVIQLAVSEMLYGRFPEHDEGKLSKSRSYLVTEQSLARVARNCSLGDFVLLGRGEDLSGGRDKDSILANAFEALMGAVFLDSDYAVARTLAEKTFSPLLEAIEEEALNHDFKSRLQERTHELFHALPSYRVIDAHGPDHDRIFEVEVAVNSAFAARGSGKSKKEAEQQAARAALEIIRAMAPDNGIS